MTDTTRSSNPNSSHSLNINLESIPDGATGSTPTAPMSLSLPRDADQAIQVFLKHYESFVATSVEDPLIWQTQAFSGERFSRSNTVSPWMKASILGVGGVSILAAAHVVWSRTSPEPALVDVQSSTSRPAASLPTSIVPEKTQAEFSPPTAYFERVQVPKIISPSIRAPLPGQVIRQQSATSITPISVPPAKVLSSESAGVTSPTSPKVADSTPVEEDAAALQVLNSPAVPLSAELPLRDSAPLDPQQSTANNPDESPLEDSAPLDPQQSTTKNPPIPALKISGISVNEKITQFIDQTTLAPQTQQVLSEQPKDTAPAARSLEDFLKLSPDLKQSQTILLPLTAEAANAVPQVRELGKFKVYRLPQATYRKVWAALNPTDQSFPTHGFIDYQERAIVLVSL